MSLESLFRNLSAEDVDQELSEVESLCINCGENGSTRLFMTKIPHYNEIIVMSFSCQHCSYENNETQFGGRIQEKGIKIKVLIQNEIDLNRQVVKSDYATVSIPQVELEIPETRKGEVTTVEGIINSVIVGLNQDQVRRKDENPETAMKIDEFITKLEDLKTLKESFYLVLDDPSGNSFIENPFAPNVDNSMETTRYDRLTHHNELLGLLNEDTNDQDTLYIPEQEVAAFQTKCYVCGNPCQTNMKPTKIPHFKEVIIMATNCDKCGHKTSEVKAGAGIEPKGLRIKVHLTDIRDLHRDVLKSDTCGIEIPELELEVGPGAQGGCFTTVEGLLDSIKEQLKSDNPLIHGDSAQPEVKSKMENFLIRLEAVQSGRQIATIILDDPAGNSYVQSLCTPDQDPNLELIHYERNFEQNEELGLNDMKTENYETSQHV
uniref:Zinc finger ZPR1-type domain-containing protein n=1 Tax=Strigamia maritima TaxID=126957 RepID=T1IQW2_STRMM